MADWTDVNVKRVKIFGFTLGQPAPVAPQKIQGSLPGGTANLTDKLAGFLGSDGAEALTGFVGFPSGYSTGETGAVIAGGTKALGQAAAGVPLLYAPVGALTSGISDAFTGAVDYIGTALNNAAFRLVFLIIGLLVIYVGLRGTIK